MTNLRRAAQGGKSGEVHQSPPPIRAVIDIGPAVHQGAGLARYASQLTQHLLAGEADRVAVSLFYNAHSHHRPPAPLAHTPVDSLPLDQVRWRMTALGSQWVHRPYRPLQEILERVQRQPGPPEAGRQLPSPVLYHATEHLLPCLTAPTVLTVHDLIFERYPEHHTQKNRIFLRLAMPRFVAAATAIIAVSNHTRQDLIRLYGVPESKITVIYEGVETGFRPAPPASLAQVKERYSPNRPYLLMVGTLEPRKNHITALRALARLKTEGFPHQLVVAGGKGWLFEPIQAQIEQLGLTGDVVLAGYVPASDLPALYTGAACVLAPSLYEGFGFPVLEAMACAAPVVCSNVSSLPEVAGGAALLVPPTDDEMLAHAVRLVLTQPALATTMREQGRRQAARFNWKRTAAETADLYAAICDRTLVSS
ncbi:MAG: glycosyltransferase family 4 protein [Anaerolineales bacterium]|nr:glycosyltransferase family 4 protein [Anaerolineales bacterium]